MPYVDIVCNSSADVWEYAGDTVMNNTDGGMAAGPRASGEDSYSFMKFTSGWTAIPAGSNITSAYLHIFPYDVGDSAMGQCSAHRLRRALSSWSQSTITYNNMPSTGGIEADFTACINNWEVINLTSFGRDCFNDSTVRSYGLRLGSQGQGGPNVLYYRDHIHSYHPYLRVNYDIPPPPSITSVAANTAKSAIVANGSGVDSNTSTVAVYSSSDNSSFSYFGNASLSSPNWSITDSSKAAAPGTPTPTLQAVNGDDVKITWTASSQGSITRYYKAHEVLTGGSHTGYSGSLGTTMTPLISKYTVERLLSGQVTWTKLGDIAAGSALEYTDTTLPLGSSAQYRVYATNSQGTVSGTTARTISVQPPPVPVFSYLDVINNNTFRLGGTGAIPPANGGTFLVDFIAIKDATTVEVRPTWAGLIDSGFTTDEVNTILEASKNYEGAAGYVVRNIHMVWDTTGIPDNATINGVEFKGRVGDYNPTDNREAVFQWYSPVANIVYAHTKATPTGASVADTLHLQTGQDLGDEEKDIFIPLINYGPYINKTGQTGLRVVISGDTPTSYNWFMLYSRDHPSYRKPTLSISYTIPPS